MMAVLAATELSLAAGYGGAVQDIPAAAKTVRPCHSLQLQ